VDRACDTHGEKTDEYTVSLGNYEVMRMLVRTGHR